jgi:hypothetical protein
MAEILGGVLTGFALYVALIAISLLAGASLLRLWKLENIDSSLLLAPALGQVFWVIGLGITVALRIPIKDSAPWLWGATSVLVLMGLPSVRAMLRSSDFKIVLLCAALPLVAMPVYFLQGLTDYLGSISPDGWSYIAFGQYIWEYPRGTDGGLAPLYQYAAHLSGGRFLSAGLLAFFSPLIRAGDTQPTSLLFQAWALFVLSTGVAFYWRTTGQSLRIVLAATALATLAGWMTNLIWANNYDNLLSLVYLPILAAILAVMEWHWRWFSLLGVLLAASLYAYAELAPFIIGAAVISVMPRLWRECLLWRRWLKGAIGTGIIVIVLLLPWGSTLLSYIQSQFNSTLALITRPGGGAFLGLVMLKYQPAAFWGLGGENQFIRFADILNVLGYGLSLIALVGLARLIRQKRWGFLAMTVFLLLGVFYYIVIQKYEYAAYKFQTIGWWALAGILVIGTERSLALFTRVNLRAVEIGLVLFVGLLAIDAQASAQALRLFVPSLQVSDYRQVNAIKEIVGREPVRVWVDDWVANEWAVYFLRDIPIDLAVYRMYMAQAHVIPFMERARKIEANIRYTLTDKNADLPSIDNRVWRKIWSGGVYALWQAQ